VYWPFGSEVVGTAEYEPPLGVVVNVSRGVPPTLAPAYTSTVTVPEASNALLAAPENSGWPVVNVEPLVGAINVTPGVVAVIVIDPVAEQGNRPPVSVTVIVDAVVVPLGLDRLPEQSGVVKLLETVTGWLAPNGFAKVIVVEFPAAASSWMCPLVSAMLSPLPSDHPEPPSRLAEKVMGLVAE
jgi:hypothetical protein